MFGSQILNARLRQNCVYSSKVKIGIGNFRESKFIHSAQDARDACVLKLQLYGPPFTYIPVRQVVGLIPARLPPTDWKVEANLIENIYMRVVSFVRLSSSRIYTQNASNVFV